MGAMNDVGLTFTAQSAANLSASSYVAVKYSSGSTHEKKLIELCGAGEVPCGILVQGREAGRNMEVVELTYQPAKITASAAITVGATCKIAANGQAVATTTDGDRIFFIADEAATAANDIIVGYTCNMFRGA